jgi:hypothetical protein
MICPTCGSEYRPGFGECAQCRVPLVETDQASAARATPRPTKGRLEPPAFELVTVFATGRADLTAVAKSILQSAEIDYAVRGEHIQDLFGWGRFPHGNGLIVGPIELQVRREDAGDASALLENLRTGEPIPGILDSGLDEDG